MLFFVNVTDRVNMKHKALVTSGLQPKAQYSVIGVRVRTLGLGHYRTLKGKHIYAVVARKQLITPQVLLLLLLQ